MQQQSVVVLHMSLFLIIYISCIFQIALRKQECGQIGATAQLLPTHTRRHTVPSLLPSLHGTLRGRGGVGGGSRKWWSRFDAPTLHERQQLLGDLCQDVLGQASHAEDLVP